MKRNSGDGQCILREARTAELAEVAELLAVSYAEYADVFPPAMWTAYRREITAVESRLAEADLLVAVAQERLVGTVTYYPETVADEHGWPDGMASLRLLAVRPTMRGRGIGRMLVEECLARARRAGAGSLGLHTAAFMRAANQLYERMGFVRCPAFDFDPYAYYGMEAGPAGEPDQMRGLAYLRELHDVAGEGASSLRTTTSRP